MDTLPQWHGKKKKLIPVSSIPSRMLVNYHCFVINKKIYRKKSGKYLHNTYIAQRSLPSTKRTVPDSPGHFVEVYVIYTGMTMYKNIWRNLHLKNEDFCFKVQINIEIRIDTAMDNWIRIRMRTF